MASRITGERRNDSLPQWIGTYLPGNWFQPNEESPKRTREDLTGAARAGDGHQTGLCNWQTDPQQPVQVNFDLDEDAVSQLHRDFLLTWNNGMNFAGVSQTPTQTADINMPVASFNGQFCNQMFTPTFPNLHTPLNQCSPTSLYQLFSTGQPNQSQRATASIGEQNQSQSATLQTDASLPGTNTYQQTFSHLDAYNWAMDVNVDAPELNQGTLFEPGSAGNTICARPEDQDMASSLAQAAPTSQSRDSQESEFFIRDAQGYFTLASVHDLKKAMKSLQRRGRQQSKRTRSKNQPRKHQRNLGRSNGMATIPTETVSAAPKPPARSMVPEIFVEAHKNLLAGQAQSQDDDKVCVPTERTDEQAVTVIGAKTPNDVRSMGILAFPMTTSRRQQLLDQGVKPEDIPDPEYMFYNEFPPISQGRNIPEVPAMGSVAGVTTELAANPGTAATSEVVTKVTATSSNESAEYPTDTSSESFTSIWSWLNGSIPHADSAHVP